MAESLGYPIISPSGSNPTNKCCQNDQIESFIVLGLSMTEPGQVRISGIEVVMLDLDRW